MASLTQPLWYLAINNGRFSIAGVTLLRSSPAAPQCYSWGNNCPQVPSEGWAVASSYRRQVINPLMAFFEWLAIRGARAKRPFAIAIKGWLALWPFLAMSRSGSSVALCSGVHLIWSALADKGHWPARGMDFWMVNIGQRYTLSTLSVALSLTIVGASAQSPSPGIAGNGHSRVIEELSAPWSAIGQINVTGYRRRIECTGSLVATNVVITAAHCIMDSQRQEPFHADQIHFLAGVRRSKWLGHSTARCLHFLPDYEYLGQSDGFPQRVFLRDVVLITLNDDLTDIAPLELDRADVQSSEISLVHAAYPADRRYVLTGQFGCHLLSHDQNLWFTDCDAHPASSGGPVFVQRKEGLKLAAIMVGVLGDSRSVAVPIANWIDVLAAARDCP